jgi:hypothetical protein
MGTFWAGVRLWGGLGGKVCVRETGALNLM